MTSKYQSQRRHVKKMEEIKEEESVPKRIVLRCDFKVPRLGIKSIFEAD